jgi:hypothetical protein
MGLAYTTVYGVLDHEPARNYSELVRTLKIIWMQIIRLLHERNLQGFLAAAAAGAGAATAVRPAAAALPESWKSTLLQN